jgi:hypothetical protein
MDSVKSKRTVSDFRRSRKRKSKPARASLIIEAAGFLRDSLPRCIPAVLTVVIHGTLLAGHFKQAPEKEVVDLVVRACAVDI